MPSDEYAPVVRGGLKLKGSGGKPLGISKPKKKKKVKADAAAGESSAAGTGRAATGKAVEDGDGDGDVAGGDGAIRKERDGLLEEEREAVEELQALRELESRDTEGDGKTASEKALEEMRRKRLQDRLQKSGVKTHKQRVEELNKYLSNLSEHHDMPRIGPG